MIGNLKTPGLLPGGLKDIRCSGVYGNASMNKIDLVIFGMEVRF
jgi:hypothetical protein